MSKFLSIVKYVFFVFFIIIALLLCWIVGLAVVFFGSMVIGVWLALIISIVGVVFLNLLLFKLLSKIFRIKPSGYKKPLAISATGLFAIVVVSLFVFPINVPQRETLNTPYETITLSKGEQMALYHLQPQKKISETPILFVPGGPGGPIKLSTLEFLNRFVAQGFEVYTFDHYSSGNSSLTTYDQSLLTIEEDVRRMHEILTKVGGGSKVFVVGHSYAGALMGRVDAFYPEQIERMVMIDTSPLFKITCCNLKSRPTFNPELGKSSQIPGTPGSPNAPSSRLGTITLIPNLSFRENMRFQILMTQWVLQTKYNWLHSMGGNDEISFGIEAGFIHVTAETPRTYSGLSMVAQSINTSIENSPDYSETLIAAHTSPVLVIHPDTGIIPWPLHKDYENFFDSVVFLPVANAEHSAWAKPENGILISNVIRDFFLNRADPSLFYTGLQDPFKK